MTKAKVRDSDIPRKAWQVGATRHASSSAEPFVTVKVPMGAPKEEILRAVEDALHRGAPELPLTAKQRRELSLLASLPEGEIDTSDTPELPGPVWSDAERGRFYRPIKKAVNLRLDADVIAWLRKDGPGYQTRVNQVLRERMLAEGPR